MGGGGEGGHAAHLERIAQAEARVYPLPRSQVSQSVPPSFPSDDDDDDAMDHLEVDALS